MQKYDASVGLCLQLSNKAAKINTVQLSKAQPNKAQEMLGFVLQLNLHGLKFLALIQAYCCINF
ncbi:hypothetical protein A6769_26185 [Nostoc punctiforme NIES-2108]|uniref:Uncharacterized protein n=1 Tax=Nostoc punctiforme NIES-2108 TaxID=1356359 RepID=A0A367RAT2_NOSPU|nr:hypothetical protein A6769_26185 [Nostoc punctiforme NIES-2108]